MKRIPFERLAPLLGLPLFAVALWILHRQLGPQRLPDVLHAVRQIPRSSVGLAAVLTAASYAALAGYDALAFRYLHRPLNFRRIALGSFVGYAFSNNVGPSLLGILGGGAVRYRIYSSLGLSTVDIAKVVSFSALTFWLGFLALGGLTFLTEPLAIPASLHLPLVSVRPVGLLFLGLVMTYLVASARGRAPLRLGEWELALPSLRLALGQLAVASLDWLLAGSVLFVLLPKTPDLGLPLFLGIFLLAQVAGLASQVPGGLGVFETGMLLLLPASLPSASVLGVLLTYRCLYYMLPLGVAGLLLAGHELAERRHAMGVVARAMARLAPDLVAPVLAATTFLGGTVLLLSGATPAKAGRIAFLSHVLPLPLLEVSHFLGSLVGVGLLLLARGLQRRLDAAWLLSALLLGAGVATSLLKGIDYEEAAFLALMLAVLLPCRRHFHRKASLLGGSYGPGWVFAILLVLQGALWLVFFSYRHLEYSNELWWRFALHGDAPRSLRATVGAVVAAAGFALAWLLRPLRPEPALPGAIELEGAQRVLGAAPDTGGWLALLADKDLLFSDSGDAFLMYSTSGRSWVALGDPVGPAEERSELVWRFHELVDRHDGWTVFYEVARENLPLYLDLDLTLLKLGEEARIPLDSFSLDGGARRALRQNQRRCQREGLEFVLLEPPQQESTLSRLAEISDAWLAGKRTREKRFSVGFFSPDYLRRCPVAVAQRDGRALAFANLWRGAAGGELSCDLMRYHPEAPPGAMDFLFAEILLWGQAQGFAWFNLGMAPLSGLEDRDLAPLWNRVGAFLFRHGEHFYNFQGLRAYKEKFEPVWQPRYLASPGGLALPRILVDVAALISGGWKGVVTR